MSELIRIKQINAQIFQMYVFENDYEGKRKRFIDEYNAQPKVLLSEESIKWLINECNYFGNDYPLNEREKRFFLNLEQYLKLKINYR